MPLTSADGPERSEQPDTALSRVDPRPVDPRRVEPRHVAAVAAIAAVPRLAWVFIASRKPVGLFDPLIYLSSAESIASGRGYRSITGTPTSYYPPGYPFFLGAVRWLTERVGLESQFFLVVGLLQAALGVLVVLGVLLLTSRLAGRRCGILAGLLVALWPNLIIHSSLLLSETLFMALFVGSLVALVIALERWSSAMDGRLIAVLLVVAGLLAGLSVLTRPQSGLSLLPAVAFGAWIARCGFRRTLLLTGVVFVGIAAVVVLWGVRNQAVLGTFVPVSTNTGDNLCIGFNPKANGGFAMPPQCQTEHSYTDGPTFEVERDAELRRSALSWARTNMSRLPGLSVSKIRLTFAGDHDGVRAAESFGRDRFLTAPVRSALTALSDIYYWAVLALSVIGFPLLVMDIRRDRTRVADAESARTGVFVGVSVLVGVVVGVMVPVLSFADQRFKVPIEPLLAVLAAVAAGWVRRSISRLRDDRRPSLSQAISQERLT